MYGNAILSKLLKTRDVILSGKDYSENIADTIPERIYKLRKRHHMSRNVVADKIGTTLASVRNWNIGRFEPTMKSLEKICIAFNLDMSDLIQ
jgi:DNA-binding transcriptional regulator YiaG